MDENEQTPAEPQAGKHAAKARRSRKPAKTQVASDDAAKLSETPPAEAVAADGEQKEEWVSKLKEPFPRSNIDIGDGRRIHFSRSNRWQQARIEFKAPAGEDPKPDAKYTNWLREHGWKWRNKEVAWTKQFDKKSDENRYARANSDLTAELEFIDLANLIRQDKGLEPSQQITEQRAAGH